MDRGARDPIVNRRFGKGISALLLLAFLLVEAGCNRWERAGPPMPPPGPEERAAAHSADGHEWPGAEEGRDASRNSGPSAPAPVPEWLPPAVATEGHGVPGTGEGGDASRVSGPQAGTSPTDNTVTDETAVGKPAIVAPPIGGHGEPGAEEGRNSSRVHGSPAAPAASPASEAKEESDVSPPRDSARSASPLPADGHGWPGAEESRDASRVTEPSAHKPKPAAAPQPLPTAPPTDIHDASLPGWAKNSEELVYRVDFIGITMGYARFRYQGKVTIDGKPAFHLNVRAWTSGILSYIFPINETIDYYLDAETIAPIRQEFTQTEREKDDVALYNQATGKITYRYRSSGKVRKQVTTVPSVYDPVSVAYYFRWKDLGVENRPRNVYGGRNCIRSPRVFSDTSGSVRNTGRWTRSPSFP